MTNASSPRSARLPQAAASAILLVVLAACSPSAAPSGTPVPGSTAGPSGAPTANPSPTAVAGIQHPTGATDVVLRLESAGGFTMMGADATNTPLFTLYGDGRVVWRDVNAPMPEPNGSVSPNAALRTVQLTETAIQSLLEDAIGRGGLGDAAETYIGAGADMPTTTFTLNANSASKTVSVMPLSPESHPAAGAIVARLAALAERLQGFTAIVGDSDAYAPTAYRGVLMPQDQAFTPPVDWPWTTITPADFTSQGNEFLLLRTLTPDDVAMLGIKGVEGGFLALTLQSGTRFYTFNLRPLLPDETK